MRILLIIFGCLFTSGCSFFDSVDRAPMFLIAEDVTLETEGDQGANTHKIRDLSVYVDGFNIGVFNLPADIPILDDDNNTKVQVIAGIRNNGNSALPIEYPFYSIEEFDYSYEESANIPFNVNFKYKEGAQFKILETFEGVHQFNANLDDDEDTNLDKNSDARSGNFSGKITNNEDHPDFEFGSTFIFNADELFDTQIFLELDYKNTIPFQIGVLGYNDQLGLRDYKIILIESEDWNKIYIDFTDEIINSQIDEFQLIFRNANAPGEYGSVWLDNIKLVHL